MSRLLCLLAVLRRAWSLRTGSPNVRPDFFACEWEEGDAEAVDCSEWPGVRSHSMDQLLEGGYRRMRDIVASGRRPLAVHVGADGLRNKARWTDVHLYSRVLARSGLPPGSLRMAFVEPLQSKSEDFWEHTTMIPASASQFSLMTAMVDGQCNSTHQALYQLSHRAGEDFGFEDAMTLGWVSKLPSFPLRVVGTWVEHGVRVRCRHPNQSADCTDNFRRFWNSPSRDSYIEQLLVPCHTLGGIVREAGAELRDVAMVVVDAESADTQILLALAGADDFRPGFIMWEDMDQKGDAELRRLLRSRGYAVGTKMGEQADQAHLPRGSIELDGRNNIAVLRSRPARA